MSEPANAPRNPWDKPEHTFGKTIVNGEVMFTSVSALELASTCLRRWWYAYKQKLKDPPSDAMDRGNKGHAEIARYLYTGERAHLSSLVLSGMHQLPPPGPDLLIEHPLIEGMGVESLKNARVRVAGIPLIGAVDLGHARPENYGVSDISQTLDEPGVLTLIDHKFPANLNNAKTATDLPSTTQMAGYGMWAFATYPELTRVRLQHNYFPVRGTPRAPSILVDHETVQDTWNQVHAVAVSIKHAARESNPDLVDANTRACRNYNKDCPAMHVCRAVKQNNLSSLVGITAADRLLQIRPKTPGDLLEMTTATEPMSLIGKLQAQRAAAQTAAPVATVQAPPLVAPPSATPAPAGPSPEVLAEIARLKALEAAAAAPVEAPIPTSVDPLLTLLAEIEACGMGLPAFSGAAAQAISKAKGYELSSSALIGGSGELAEHVFDDVAVLPDVLTGARQIAADRATSSAPGNTPATSPVETTTPAEKPAKKKAGRPPKAKPAEVESAAQPVVVNVTMQAPAVPPIVIPDAVLEVPPVPTPIASAPAPVVVEPTPTPAANTGPINCYVDCAIAGLQTQSLWPLVDFIMDNMSADSGAADWRFSDPQGKYGFGKGVGILAACLREAPSKGLLPAGNYHLDGSMGQIGGHVSETMRQICRATGGVFVKGAR